MIVNSNQKSALTLISVLISIVSTTFLISILARGYIPEYDNGLKITATGLLSATSIPKNASIIINDKLYSTTDNTINLVPNDYQLKIIKDGYLPWTKKITIQKEMVYQAEANLFKTNPKLSALTTNGAIAATPNSDQSQIIYISPPSSTSAKPGIYLIETNYYLPLITNKYQPKFIATNPFTINDKTITFTFSPNSKQVIAKSIQKHISYLIDLTTNEITIPTTKTTQEWQTQSNQINLANINKLPKLFTTKIATNPASIQFSSDENKFFYLNDKQYYCYDIEKDMLYQIGAQNEINSPFWLPKSNSIIYGNSGKIKSMEFDGSNNNTIFSNDYLIKTIIPQYDGDKLIISTSIDTTSNIENIYSLTIR